MPKKSSNKKKGVEPQDEVTAIMATKKKSVVILNEFNEGTISPSAHETLKEAFDAAAPTPPTRYEEIPLNRIKLSPTNPRTTYDEKDTQELAESIKVEGVIQPVLLRPYGQPGWYQLIFGNRRYKASILAGKETIPSLIREMSDEESLNLQIIENLQRKDVKPMEEASSYKMLMDMKGYSVAELSHRLGKPTKFISQRLKLNDLAAEFQKALYEERITITDALKVCKLTPADQEELYKEIGDEILIEILDHTLNKFTYDLTKATFDINDKTIIPSMGACSGCHYNTACAALFPDPDEKARCTNTGCFKSKTQLWYDRELLTAKEDPAIVMVSYESTNTKITEDLSKEGVKVYLNNEFDEVLKPEFDPYCDKPDENSTEDDKEDWQREVDSYDREVLDYQKDLESSTHAFVVDGQNKGEYIYVKLLDTKGKFIGKDTATGKATDENAVKAEQLREEITRIEDKEKRQKQLDWFKVLPDVYKLFEDKGTHKNSIAGLTIIEQAAVILELIGYNDRNFTNWAKVPESGRRSKISLYNWLKTKSTEQLDKWITIILREKMLGYIRPLAEQHPFAHANILALLDQAQAYFPERSAEINLKMADKFQAREKKVGERLAELRAQIKELEGTKLDKIIKGSKKK